jgi:hypothetical protein
MSGWHFAERRRHSQANEQRLAPAQRKTALFYLPDGITPWAQQTINWTLGFFERLYASSIKRQNC